LLGPPSLSSSRSLSLNLSFGLSLSLSLDPSFSWHLGLGFEPCLACGINHLTGSVASLVAPTTTATTSHFSMWPLKDICLFVRHPGSQSASRSVGRLVLAFCIPCTMKRSHCKLKSKSVAKGAGTARHRHRSWRSSSIIRHGIRIMALGHG